jgi:hypothetical protein
VCEVADRVTMGQVFVSVLWVSRTSIILSLLHIHSCIIWEMTNGATKRHGGVVNTPASYSGGLSWNLGQETSYSD